ncbi:MAG: 50S ribosomal protein L6, partial [Verrucomicrobiales bacterium]|nr:50S ribosomal protein L6 [Verrucomicrobiales bacterium]
MSRVGKKSISLPEKVSVKVDESSQVTVEGPKGRLEWQLPQGISLNQDGGELSLLNSNGDDRRLKALHGTARALISNMVVGVSQGFQKDLEIIGVGFRAVVKGSLLDLSLGYSHP